MHVQIVSLSTGKSGPTFILALGMWAGAEMGGFKQLEDDLPADSLEQLGRNCHWQLELARKQSSLSNNSVCVASCAKHMFVLKPPKHATAQA